MRKFISKVQQRFRPTKNRKEANGQKAAVENTEGAASATPAVDNAPAQANGSGPQNDAVVENDANPTTAAPATSRAPVIDSGPEANGAPVATEQQPIKTVQQDEIVNADTAATLQIQFVNMTTSSTVYAYITGQALDNGNELFLLQADGQTPYYPSQPNAIGSPLAVNVAIALGAPGHARNVTIPRIAGGRIWFSIDTPLTFYLNPGGNGPALVEPSVTNQSDANINTLWSFAEFTYNSDQLYANVSSVDFVGIPIALNLLQRSGATQTVTGARASGLDTICAQLSQQTSADGQPGWRRLIVNHNGRNIRALSPNSLIATDPSAFAGYFEPYVNQVWQHYTTQPLTVKNSALGASGQVSNGQLNLSGEQFAQPSTRDIFSSNSGPFTTGADGTRNAIIPILAAAFNRSTLLSSNTIPANLQLFYQNAITNHYSRIVHANAVDGRGYAFPYDDVDPANAGDQSGRVNAGDPQLLTVTVGGGQY